MNIETDRFLSFVREERARHRKRLAMNALVAALLAVLLYETQWPNLRVGLLVLLTEYVGSATALAVRNMQLAKTRTMEGAWFEREELFMTRLAMYEGVIQAIGFLCLGYALWVSTRNLAVALGIGVVYPVTTYLGINRGRTRAAVKQLDQEKRSMGFADQDS